MPVPVVESDRLLLVATDKEMEVFFFLHLRPSSGNDAYQAPPSTQAPLRRRLHHCHATELSGPRFQSRHWGASRLDPIATCLLHLYQQLADYSPELLICYTCLLYADDVA
jgi:hypothetical protein